MNDRNENPLPDYIDPTKAVTIRDWLTQAHHPAEDLEYAATRYGRKVYDAYLRLHRTKPYTLRIGGSGPVKVYLPSDRPLLTDIYTAWHEQERRRRSALKE